MLYSRGVSTGWVAFNAFLLKNKIALSAQNITGLKRIKGIKPGTTLTWLCGSYKLPRLSYHYQCNGKKRGSFQGFGPKSWESPAWSIPRRVFHISNGKVISPWEFPVTLKIQHFNTNYILTSAAASREAIKHTSWHMDIKKKKLPRCFDARRARAPTCHDYYIHM